MGVSILSDGVGIYIYIYIWIFSKVILDDFEAKNKNNE